jgi:hypothetical protein
MVDSLPPSGTAPDNKTISTNSNDKLQVIESTAYLAYFNRDNQDYPASQNTGDWTGIDDIGNSGGRVWVDKSELPRSASVTGDLTGIDVLNFRIHCNDVNVKIKVDEVELVTVEADGYQTLEISGLDEYDFGTNSTLTIEAYEAMDTQVSSFHIDYVYGLIQPESRKIELVDTGGEL